MSGKILTCAALGDERTQFYILDGYFFFSYTMTKDVSNRAVVERSGGSETVDFIYLGFNQMLLILCPLIL